MSRALISDTNFLSSEPLENLIKYIHYYPPSWRNNNYKIVEADLNELYKQKVLVFLQEIISVFSTPFVLFSLSESVEDIIEFIKDNTASESGLGHVCSLATFSKDTDRTVAYLDAEKMSKSVLTFAINHPNWNMPDNFEPTVSLLKTQFLNENVYFSVISFVIIGTLRTGYKPLYKSYRYTF